MERSKQTIQANIKQIQLELSTLSASLTSPSFFTDSKSLQSALEQSQKISESQKTIARTLEFFAKKANKTNQDQMEEEEFEVVGEPKIDPEDLEDVTKLGLIRPDEVKKAQKVQMAEKAEKGKIQKSVFDDDFEDISPGNTQQMEENSEKMDIVEFTKNHVDFKKWVLNQFPYSSHPNIRRILGTQGEFEYPAKGQFYDEKSPVLAEYRNEDGDVYVGQWWDGKPHGRGKWFSGDGKDFYEGEFKDGKFHGIGRRVDSDGLVMEGKFKDNQFEGVEKWL